MMYAKFINEKKIEYLPKNAVLGGESFSNARLLPQKFLADFGYFPVIKQPEIDYNPEYEYLDEIYSLEGDKIIVSYKVEELFI